jgi:hypothetical protein
VKLRVIAFYVISVQVSTVYMLLFMSEFVLLCVCNAINNFPVYIFVAAGAYLLSPSLSLSPLTF